ncbi:hypothetical protein V1Y59_10135 [Gordonia sp. PKS22-38]|uniref:Uncharacterized protein n=1 Tax=Gordonia prachuapensis TaxID=3115651 RepID=A0ABU7MSY1_9ACTN|nr:hypothetical protein [Gordonia sp. PKS22-38]
MKYQLDIISDCVDDLVQHAGGWIYDRATAGWEVTVSLPLGVDRRPIQILGAHTTLLDLSRDRLPCSRPAIATSVAMCRRDARLAAMLTDAYRDDTEITLWGDGDTVDDDLARGAVSHRLSVAARAFKAQALAAVGSRPTIVGRHETFRTSKVSYSDLVPAG